LNARLTAGLVAALIALPALAPAADAAKKAKLPKAPSGSRFYSPPKKLVKGKPGTPIWVRAARGLVRPPHAGRVITIAYRSTSIRNKATVMTGTIALPKGKPPKAGWPVVTFGHVTTGGADSCAPSRVTAGNTEVERMTRSDEVVGYLLDHRIAVARPDFEGIGTPGRHPYLIGSSLARSMTDIVRAGRRLKLGLGRRWAAAGHSEGGMAALWTAKVGPRRAPGLSFRGTAAFAPASHISDIVELARNFKTVSPLTTDFSALGGLILEGAAVAEPALWQAYRDGGLSPEALARMPDTQRLCLADLGDVDSLGGIAPGKLEGPKAGQYLPSIYAVLDRNDPGTLKLPGVPVRLDQGSDDLVVWESQTSEVASQLATAGADVTLQVWEGGTHENITDLEYAAGASADWLIGRLR
jgi:pimeloyl-ACP methyl ester carboxylesterase